MIDKFIYNHILKTAGTTIRYGLLTPVYKERCLYDSMFKLKRKENKKIKTEHPLIIENQLYPPVNYEKYDVIFGHFKYDKYEHLNRPMFSFVRHPVDRMISNYYYFKGSYKKMGQNLSLIEFSEMWKNHMTDVLGDISKYEFIGVVENFDKSLKRMCKILGILAPKRVISRRVNKRYKPNEISKKIRARIEKMNLKDMELYHEVLKKWQ
jgi:hypothetical protein